MNCLPFEIEYKMKMRINVRRVNSCSNLKVKVALKDAKKHLTCELWQEIFSKYRGQILSEGQKPMERPVHFCLLKFFTTNVPWTVQPEALLKLNCPHWLLMLLTYSRYKHFILPLVIIIRYFL